MGSCFSTPCKPSPSRKTPPTSNSKTAAKHSSTCKLPPTTNPLPEKETVKEVLSEASAFIRKQPSPPIPKAHERVESPFIKKAPLLQDSSRTAHDKEHQNSAVDRRPFTASSTGDLSEVSEICSLQSESVSASPPVTEKRDRKNELRELRQGSPARFNNRQFSSEGRISELSPRRVRPITGSGKVRKDSGESSGRMPCKSAAMRTESGPSKPGHGSRTQSGRTGKSPGRVESGSRERIRKVDGGKESGNSKSPPRTSNESLENPSVSLECFIFL